MRTRTRCTATAPSATGQMLDLEILPDDGVGICPGCDEDLERGQEVIRLATGVCHVDCAAELLLEHRLLDADTFGAASPEGVA